MSAPHEAPISGLHCSLQGLPVELVEVLHLAAQADVRILIFLTSMRHIWPDSTLTCHRIEVPKGVPL